MDTIPKVVPALQKQINWNRNLSKTEPLNWLSKGWRDLKTAGVLSLFYGKVVFLVSLLLVSLLYLFQIEHFLLPAISAFMVIGPAFAVGLYEISHKISMGEPFSFSNTRPRLDHAGGQILFVGVILFLLVMLWIRAAVLLYALFFGLQPFTGLEAVPSILLNTSSGWALLIVGSLVGGLFAAFSFAISVFSIPMLLDKNIDAFSAMGMSIALAWHNKTVMIVWGFIVLALFLVSCLTGFLGLIVIFPLLGHASWHAYLAIRQSDSNPNIGG